MTTTDAFGLDDSVSEVRGRLAAVLYDHARQWSQQAADVLISSALGGQPAAPASDAGPTPGGSLPGLPAVWDALKAMAWLHAELAHRHAELERKHAGLVAEIQTMMQQAMGPAGMDPQRLQEFRQRAVRIARHRAAQQQQGAQP